MNLVTVFGSRHGTVQGHFYSALTMVLYDSIQINHQLDATILSTPVYYPDVYSQLSMFQASSRPSSRAQQLR
jgi:hypothetical protein